MMEGVRAVMVNRAPRTLQGVAMKRLAILLTGLNGALAVGAGAYGAHAMGTLPDDVAAMWNTASLFHLIHAASLAGVTALVALMPDERWFRISFALLFGGVVLFCGSLYLRALVGISAGPVTPAGGIAFMLGWLALVPAAWRR